MMGFEEYYLNNLPSAKSFHPHFDEALRWILEAGGKHFRAKLLLGALEALSGDGDGEKAYPIAAAVEIFHAYSLIHDDLPCMDNADLRRGKEALHIKYGETTAVLVGDALNTHAFLLIANADLSSDIRIKCAQILAEAGGINGMVLGQALDCYFENTILKLDELKFLHSKKTGALIAASMQIGAVIAGYKDDDLIKRCGEILGLAFQIHDDIIDATMSSEMAGKPVNNDQNKNSFVNLLGLNAAKTARDEALNELLSLSPSPLKGLLTSLTNRYLKD